MFYQFPFWVGKKFQVSNQRRYLTVSIHHTWEVLKAFGNYLVRVKFFFGNGGKHIVVGGFKIGITNRIAFK